MKRAFIFLSSILLIMGTAVAALAVPVEFTFTADNIVGAWYKNGGSPELIDLSDASHLSDWRVADSLSLEFEAGSHQVIWKVFNDRNPGPGNPGGFLGQIEFPDESLINSSNSWEVAVLENSPGAAPSDVMTWDFATQWATNEGPSIWTSNNSNNPVAGIALDAYWIWSSVNFGNSGAPGTNDSVFIRASFDVAPVPEPATMLLLGFGLVGLAAVGRKRLFNK